MKICSVRNVSFTHNDKGGKSNNLVRKPLIYTMVGLMSLGTLNSCVEGNNEDDNYQNEITMLDYYNDCAQYQAAHMEAYRMYCEYYSQHPEMQMENRCGCNSNCAQYSNNSVASPTKMESNETDIGFNNGYKKAIKFLFKTMFNNSVQVTYDDEDDEIFVKSVGSIGYKWHYRIKHTSNGIVVTKDEHILDSPEYQIYQIKIQDQDDDGFTVTVCDKTDKTFKFDKYGNMISQAKQNMINQSVIQKELDNIKMFDNTNKKMLAYVISSLNISDIDVLQQDGYVEIFGDNENSSYQFIVKKGKDNSVYGLACKMLSDANLQTETSDASSEIYAFMCSDKTTDNTERMQVSSVRVVQNSLDDASDMQNKFGERTSETHKVSDYKIARGLLGGADILATNKKTFTTKYLSEGTENRIYTLDDDDRLKINGKYAFSNEF